MISFSKSVNSAWCSFFSECPFNLRVLGFLLLPNPDIVVLFGQLIIACEIIEISSNVKLF